MVSQSPELDALRNEVDLISNSLSFSWETDDPIGSILLEAQSPPNALPILLHELTHWQCFQGAVGTAFRQLRDIIAQGSYKQETVATAQAGEVPKDFQRLIANMSVGLLTYLPWIEGLALFAEWDALPGYTEVLSKPMLFSFVLNPDVKSVGDQLVRNQLRKLGSKLRRARRNSSAEGRKVNLLATRLLGPKGHYLAGYLGVKALHRDAVSRCELFRDTDFFLAFAMGRLFQDPQAATILYDTETDFPHWSDLLVGRLVERIGIFNSPDLSGFAKLYEIAEQYSPLREEAIAASDSQQAKLVNEVPEGYVEGCFEAPTGIDLLNGSLGLTFQDWDVLQSIETATRKKYVPESTRPLNETLLLHALGLRQRNMIRLRRVVGLPRFDELHLWFYGENARPIARCRRYKSAIPYGEAVYLLYFDAIARCLMRLVLSFKDGRADILGMEVYPRTEHPLKPDQIDLLVRAAVNSENYEQTKFRQRGSDRVMEWLDAIIDADSRETFVKQASDVALVPVLNRLPGHMHTFVEDGLSKLGIFGLIGKSRPTANAAARISLLASEQLPLGKIIKRMAGDDQSADEFLKHLDALGIGLGRFYSWPIEGYSSWREDDTDAFILGF